MIRHHHYNVINKQQTKYLEKLHVRAVNGFKLGHSGTRMVPDVCDWFGLNWSADCKENCIRPIAAQARFMVTTSNMNNLPSKCQVTMRNQESLSDTWKSLEVIKLTLFFHDLICVFMYLDVDILQKNDSFLASPWSSCGGTSSCARIWSWSSLSTKS